MDGFFTASEAMRVRPAASVFPRCDHCGLYKSCKSPKMPVDGGGRRGVLICSDYPGRDEDRDGRPMVGGAGRLTAAVCRDLGVDMRADCWLTNAARCHGAHDHKTATDDCRPNLLNAIKELKPSVVVLAGGQAVKSLLGFLWKADAGPAGRWAGWRIPARPFNCWVCPTFNPAHLLHDDRDPVPGMMFRKHLDQAFALAGTRPWPAGPPDTERDVEVVADPDAAAARLARHTAGAVVFDFETNMIKPDHRDAEVVCCSVCWEGQETIAFPWHGAAKPALKNLLEDPAVAKIGYNIKFEDRWCRDKLGIGVRGWAWDGMLAAHCLDPRKGVTGLKFQAFARLGEPDYNFHVESFLQSRDKGGYEPNRVREIAPRLLMRYCGMDAILEYRVAQLQMAEMGLADPPSGPEYPSCPN